MLGLVILADGFEDSEAIITIDLLRRAHINLDVVCMNKTLTCKSGRGLEVVCDKTFKDINLKDYNFLVIPGGQAVFKYHLKSDLTKSIVDYFMNKGLLVACICAAPMILGNLGYLKGKNYTCFPGCQSDIFLGDYQDQEVVIDGNIITSKAMGTTFAFGEAIITKLLSSDAAQKVINEVYYQK